MHVYWEVDDELIIIVNILSICFAFIPMTTNVMEIGMECELAGVNEVLPHQVARKLQLVSLKSNSFIKRVVECPLLEVSVAKMISLSCRRAKKNSKSGGD